MNLLKVHFTVNDDLTIIKSMDCQNWKLLILGVLLV